MTPEEVYALGDKVVAFLIARLGAGRQDAEDAMAEVVEWAVAHGGMPSPSYVFKAAKYRLLDIRDSAYARRTSSLEARAGDGEDAERHELAVAGFEEALAGRIAATEALRGCSLPAVQLRALSMRYVELCGWNAIARDLGCHVWEAKRHVDRALYSLRAQLDGEEASAHVAGPSNISAVLARCPDLMETQQKAVALRVLCGCSQQEVGLLMGVNQNRAKSYIRIGVRALAQLGVVTIASNRIAVKVCPQTAASAQSPGKRSISARPTPCSPQRRSRCRRQAPTG